MICIVMSRKLSDFLTVGNQSIIIMIINDSFTNRDIFVHNLKFVHLKAFNSKLNGNFCFNFGISEVQQEAV